ncbi:hypothetical protein ACIQ9E_24495 [Streptomyces sp. NPDC094448]|uniref:hypothetical protein n=1 Tax=Streptomyces sp. NPDC094448 TaxID=3366063 RepID=UPI003805AC97
MSVLAGLVVALLGARIVLLGSPKRLHPVLPGPDRQLEKAWKAARRGRWEPMAELLADTGQDWDRRAYRVGRIGRLAEGKSDAWLTGWERARPDDADAAVVRAAFQVRYAWHLRGARRAANTSPKQFADFHRALEVAREATARAARLNPDDPSPLVQEVWVALGLGYPHSAMDDLWKRITERSPHNFEAHAVALQYWCKKWHGSEKPARKFAESAAARAPSGSPLAALPLFEWYEHQDETASEARYRSARVTAAVDTARARMESAPPDLPGVVDAHHMLAYFLVRQGRYQEAKEHFRVVDGYAGALPWRYYPWGLSRMVFRRYRTKAERGGR